MRIEVSGGGGAVFVVKNDKRDDLEIGSNVTPYEAVHMVAEWLAVAPVEEPAPKGKSIAPKADK